MHILLLLCIILCKYLIICINDYEFDDDICKSIFDYDNLLNNNEYINERLQELIWKYKNGDDITLDYKKELEYDTDDININIYSRNRNDTKLKEYMSYGILNITKEQLLNLIMNIDNRKQWDDTYIDHKILGHCNNICTDIIFSVSKYPKPLSNRTYVQARTLFDINDGYIILFNKSINYNYQCDNYNKLVRIDNFENLLILKNFEPDYDDNNNEIINKCYMLSTYFEDPKINIPNILLDLIVKRTVPKLLEKMVIAAKQQNYEQSIKYCNNLQYIKLPNIGI